jgi:hypothetical protein
VNVIINILVGIMSFKGFCLGRHHGARAFEHFLQWFSSIALPAVDSGLLKGPSAF